MKAIILSLLLLVSCCKTPCEERLPPLTGKEFTDCEGNLVAIETMDLNMCPFPPNLAINENISIFMKMSILKAKERESGTVILRQERTDEGFFAVMKLPNGLYNSIDCYKGCLAYCVKERLIIISYLVPLEKETSVEYIREKMLQIKCNLVNYL